MKRTLMKGALASGLLASVLFMGTLAVTPVSAFADEADASDEIALVDASDYAATDTDEPAEATPEEAADDDVVALSDQAFTEDDLPNSWRFYNGQLMPNVTGESLRSTYINNSYKYWMSWRAANGTTSYSIVDTSNNVVETKSITTGVKAVGIDVSSYQGTIDWAKVKADGVTFAILRCRSFDSNGNSIIDPQLAANIKGAKANGIKLGVYIYSYAGFVSGSAWNESKAVSDAKNEAQRVVTYLNQCGVTASDLPLGVYYDIEDNRQISFSKSTFANMATTFASVVTNAGYSMGIYASQSWYSSYLTDSVFTNRGWNRWVARYPVSNSTSDFSTEISSRTSNTDIWQFSDGGRVNGISGDVDMNFAYVDFVAPVDTTTYVTPTCDTAVTITSALSSGKVLDVASGSSSNSANVQLYSGNLTLAQRFYVKANGDGTYTIVNVNSGKVLDVKGAGKTNGTNVQQYASNGTSAQKWKFIDAGNGYVYIQSVCNGLYLDISGASSANGANVQVYAGNKTNAQKFKLDYFTQPIANGTYTIQSAVNKNAVLDVKGASTGNSANVQIYQSNGTDAQRFVLAYDAQKGLYTIKNVKSGKVLDVYGGKSASGTNVQQYTPNGTNAQYWTLVAKGNSQYMLQSATGACVLDLSGAKTANGTNVLIYKSNDSAAQRWYFVAA